MRTIKFRGRTDYGRWVYGDLRQGSTGNMEISRRLEDKHYCYAVERDTVGQFTGLKDKSGTEIYEGDIIRYSKQNVAKVVWSTSMAKFMAIDNIRSFGGLNDGVGEIIGNIHDNPELMKGGEL